MEQSEFVRLLSESASQFSWLLGAGMSQSAGLPTAVDIMWELKRQYYCTEENQRISPNDLQNTAVREKIDAYMQTRGFLPQGDPGEYSACFDLIFKNDHERQRRYLVANLADDKISLSIGHRILGAMIASKVAKVVFTTNFDTVIEKSVAAVSGSNITPFHLEGSYAANAAFNSDEFPMCVKLHGDFRYQSIKNLADDLKVQDAELGKCLINASNRFGMVVAGYSGRDESIMKLLTEAIAANNPFPHGLFWTVLKGRKPLKAVDDLLAAARARGVRAEFVEIETFDSLMSRLWKQLPDRDPALVDAVGKATSRIVNLPVPPPGTHPPFLRMNALPVVALPKKCIELRFSTNQEWQNLRDAEKRARDQLICTKETTIWAWGHESNIRKAFGSELIDLREVDIGNRIEDLAGNQYLKGFFEQGLAFGFKRGNGIPWKLAGLDRKSAFIGISYAMKTTSSGMEYTTCCSQVFDPDGTGFQFVAYDTRDYTKDRRDNPYLSYNEMLSVMSRSLEIYQRGHSGRAPKKVTIHKNTPFQDEEALGAIDAFNSQTEVELVQIVKSTNWSAIRYNSQATPVPDGYPITRGTYLPISPNEAFLWTQGSVRGVHMNGPSQDVYKEGALKPIPSPLIIRRFSGSGGWFETCSGIIGLTKMDWNNNTLYKKLPITLEYSQEFAKIIQQNPELVDAEFDFRNFM